MENLKKFNTQEEYQAWKDGDNYVYPNVCKVGDEVIYNGYPEPFWIEALEDVSVGFTSNWQESNYCGYWSFDNTNWRAWSNKVTVRKGEKLYLTYNSSAGEKWLWVSGKYNVGGSILSLVYGKDYLNYNTHDFVFQHLFKNALSVVSAKELVLATDFKSTSSNTSGMYYQLFNNCTLLEEAPRLPNALSAGCYNGMFNNCSSLYKAPSLLATKSAINNGYAYYYRGMFTGCSNLSYIKMLLPMAFDGTDTTSNWSGNWVKGVSSTGTFIANSKRTDFTRGPHGIPEGWDLYLYDEDKDRYVIKFKVNDIPYEYYTDKPKDITWNQFINSEYNTNGFVVGDGKGSVDVRLGNDRVLYNGKLILYTDNIILNATYTIGQPTATTTEEE